MVIALISERKASSARDDALAVLKRIYCAIT